VKIKQAESQSSRSEKLFFMSGSDLRADAIERICADTPAAGQYRSLHSFHSGLFIIAAMRTPFSAATAAIYRGLP
jgi:hypothetical protein